MKELEQDQMRAAIGPRADYYLAQFEKIERGGNGWSVTWNWPAFFVSSAWFAYRRMGGRSLGNYTRSVVYDAGRRMIVVTMGDKRPLEGKRFALYAEEKGGTLSWSCRTIDLERKYLPAACRD